MKACKNASKGCSKWFNTAFGARVHLQSCLYTSDVDDRKEKIPLSSKPPMRIGGDGLRLACDEWTFQEERVGNFQTLKDASEDILKNHNCLSTDMESFSKLSENERLVKLLMLRLAKVGRKSARSDVNSILEILTNPSFSIERFSTRCKNYNDCMNEENLSIDMIGKSGFEKTKIVDPETNYSCYIYYRSPIEVLREQISGSNSRNTIFNRTEMKSSYHYCHPMNADIGSSAVNAVRHDIMSHDQNDVLWLDSNKSIHSSFVGLVQLYSDKSQNSLKASGFQFYPMHITILNFSEEQRRKCIVSGQTFLAFLPTEFFQNEADDILHDGAKRFQRRERLRLLHLSIEYILQPLARAAYTGFTCVDQQTNLRQCHPSIVSYCCDLPESKDLTSVKNGNQSIRNCHRCLANTTDFNKYTTNESRNGIETCSIIKQAIEMRKNGNVASAEELLKRYSLTDQIPSLSKLPFVDCHSQLDFHSIFMFEPLHGFHLGISKEIKKCAAERLKSEDRFTTSLPTKLGNDRTCTWKNVRMTILNGINKLLSHIQSNSPASGLRIDFSKSDKEESGNGLFNGEGNLMGMLEGKDLKSIDMVSPFIGMFLDRCTGEVATATTTNIFVQYVDLMQMALSYDEFSYWTEARVQLLEDKIKKFKDDTRNLYEKHHSSDLCTEKMHMLDHIPNDIRRAGGLNYGDASLYEYAHTIVKKAYRCGSKRSANAMDETIELFVKDTCQNWAEEALEISPSNSITAKDPLKNVNRHGQAIRDDCGTLAGKGRKILLSDISKSRIWLRKVRKAREKRDTVQLQNLELAKQSFHNSAMELIIDVGEDGSRVLYNQLLTLSSNMTTRSTIVRVASCYVPGIITPTLDDYDEERNAIILQISTKRKSQRIVSERNFHGSNILRQDCILIQGSDGERGQFTSLWVGKVLAFLKIRRDLEETSTNEGIEEYVFVQYFDAVPPRDQIDKKLNCIRLQWATDSHEQNLDSITGKNSACASKWFDLLPVSSIRGRVHVVRGDFGVAGLGATREIDDVPWSEQFFYINRFYRDADQRYYNTQSV